SFVKYDSQGRVAYSGLFSSAASRSSLQATLDNMSSNALNNESRTDTPFSLNGLDIYYTNAAFPTAGMTVMSVNYYDRYPAGSPAVPATVLQQATLSQAPVSITSNGYTTSRSVQSLPVAGYTKNIENDSWSSSFIWYDQKARPVGTYGKNHLGGYTRTESEIDFSGVTKQSLTYHKRLDTNTETVIRHRFVYDSQNRLKQHYHQINAQPEELLSDNTYNDLGQITNKKVGGNLQSIDYSYNIRGWLTGINKPSDLGSDLFGYNIRYTAREGAETPNSVYPEMKVRPLYNGSITEVDWKTSGKQSDGNLRRYGFVYDHLSRMRAGFYQDVNNPYSREYSEYLEYDLNGNITRLNRTGKLQGTSAEVMDDLVYHYQNAESSNQLSYVSETGSGNAGSGYPISGNGQAIAYDSNGNITSLPDKGISSISYNFLNLPVTIQNVKGDKTAYLYSSDGSKLRKRLPGKTVDYLDGFQYENGVLQFFPTEDGYYDAVGSRYVYHYTDHAGNIRLSFTSVNGIASVLEENNYYPFGLKHQQYNTGSSSMATYNYKFGGSELQENGMYDFGARMYMPDLGRWGVMDPLAEIMRSHSPYNYAYNNPVNYIDPDGMAPRRLTMANADSPLDYEPSPGLNPNRIGMGNNVGYGDSYGFGSVYSGGGGSATSSSSTFFNNTFNLGGSWSNTGTSFVSSDNIGLGYDGSYTSLNTALDDYFNIPTVYLTGKSSGWGNQIQSHFNSFINKWNKPGGVYGAIQGLTSYLANSIDGFIGTTNEEFPQITDPGGLARTDFDASTWDKFRPGDKTFILDKGSFIQPASLPGGNGFGDRDNAFAEGVKNLLDVIGLFNKKEIDTVYFRNYTFDKDGIKDTLYQTPIKKGETWESAYNRVYKMADSIKTSKY
ncbi:RHS repeat domain-containing protein, partial [Chryseobacterium camelliae]|uniref:RHS repeat domain-containing protein n=1 Tax=Chryseobacterium camelliae TaxID=1265445 RepID=UPI00285F279E